MKACLCNQAVCGSVGGWNRTAQSRVWPWIKASNDKSPGTRKLAQLSNYHLSFVHPRGKWDNGKTLQEAKAHKILLQKNERPQYWIGKFGSKILWHKDISSLGDFKLLKGQSLRSQLMSTTVHFTTRNGKRGARRGLMLVKAGCREAVNYRSQS